jgi:photosystem II stability/assembly factor-like uncharacterized protein
LATWSVVSGISLKTVTFLDQNTAVAVGAAGSIVETNDAGLTWTTLPSGTTNYLNGVAFAGDHGLVVGATGTILETNDRGATWKFTESGTSQAFFDVAFPNPQTAIVVGNEAFMRKTWP